MVDDIVFLGAADDIAFQGDGRDWSTARTTTTGCWPSVPPTRGLRCRLRPGPRGSPRHPAGNDSTIAVETLDLNAAGGQDLIDVGDLSASDLVAVEADLGLDDGARDDVSVQGTDSSDLISAGSSGEEVRVVA